MIKRLTDLVYSGLGLVVLAPFFALIAFLIRREDGGRALFIQTRVGKGGQPFAMLKFRSMTEKQTNGASLTIGQDARITALGLKLRRYKIDELPQLWNVFRGEMSLVGPRPEIAHYVNLYSEEQRRVLSLKPGITDPASFAFFDESELLARAADPEQFYIERLMPEKIRINLAYQAKSNIWTDHILILATLARAAGFNFDIFRWLRIERPAF